MHRLSMKRLLYVSGKLSINHQTNLKTLLPVQKQNQFCLKVLSEIKIFTRDVKIYCSSWLIARRRTRLYLRKRKKEKKNMLKTHLVVTALILLIIGFTPDNMLGRHNMTVKTRITDE